MRRQWLGFVQRYRLALYFLIACGLAFLSRRISIELIIRFQVERTPLSELTAFFLVSVLILLAYFVMRSILILLVQRYRKVLGSMLSFRLAVSYVIATVVPVMILTLFITHLINVGIDVIHQPRIEKALQLSIDYLRENRRQFVGRLQQRAAEFFKTRQGFFTAGSVNGWEEAGRLQQTVFKHRFQGVYDANAVIPAGPDLTQVTLKRNARLLYHKIIAEKNSVEYIVLQPPPLFSPDAENVGNALAEYRQIRLFKEPLKYLLMYLVLIVAALSILLVMLISMRQAKHLTEPVIALAEGTRRVANGDLDYRVQVSSNDELRLLVANFNRMTVQLRRSRQQLYHAERIAAWQEVARRLAHEIKNPLTPIKLSAERVLRRNRKQPTELGPVIEKALTGIVEEVDHIKMLVDEFASFARLPEKRILPVGIKSFTSRVFKGFEQAHENLELICTLPEQEFTADIDPEQIKRALVNLMQNAIRAALQGHAQPGRVELSLQRDAGSMLFMVRDNGDGIPEQDGARIFDPYYSSAEGGTGLGLAIVEKIVLDHGGRVWFETLSGQGTDFFIELPETVQKEQQHETHSDS